ncbi:WhiB family transcriptional regulator [Nocardiopsis sp. CT-R113]|uniref:WhiB family transcriptional regulator n=1 Tax=Nocardiopsis codii TaxID=3065942 RepID=A0ABU7K1S6_9ACTN|nr:WhiB family transcriptional regulator [Nocardiopsis sp. CT-R113]MEE2036115.1 WhiB family transcriptional regulator [Nocardiopsis sp. CT-R113]
MLSTSQIRTAIGEQVVPCTDQSDLFFEPDTSDRFGEKPAAREMRERSARTLCLSCPARDLCLELALREKPAAGIWAGFSSEEITDYLREAA